MNVGAILAGIGLFVAVAAYVARPLFEEQPDRKNGRALSPRAGLTARRDAVYALIRELDADHQTGKVEEQDYQAQRQRYVAEGVSLLQQLDALSSDGDQAALEAEIEAKVRTLRQARAPRAQRGGADVDGEQPTPRFCTQCGQRADPKDNFCGHCGAPLKRAT